MKAHGCLPSLSFTPKIRATGSLDTRNSTTHTALLIFKNSKILEKNKFKFKKKQIVFFFQIKKKVGAGGKSGARADENNEC